MGGTGVRTVLDACDPTMVPVSIRFDQTCGAHGEALPLCTYTQHMRAHVYVTLKPTVLDAQGQTIANALKRMQHPDVQSVRQGKYFVLTLADTLSPEAAKSEVERIAAQVLANPVIEDYTFRLE